MLPLRQAARQAFGEPVPYLEQYLDHEDLSDAYWREMAPDLSRWQVPTALQGGWWDGAPGHRLRLQVSGGAFPRFARNTGTGEPLATATRLVPADVVVYHDQARPSALLLPATAPAARVSASSRSSARPRS